MSLINEEDVELGKKAEAPASEKEKTPETKQGNDEISGEGEEKILEPVPLKSLFRYCDCFDVLLMIVGSISGILNGTVYPLLGFVLGGLFDDLSDPNLDFLDVSITYAKYFSYLVVGNFVVASIQWACFALSSTRQTFKMRRSYVRALLRQDITFFDSTSSGSLTSSISANIVTISTALGDKLGAIFQFGSMTVTGLAVGFIVSAKLSSVMLAFIPLLAIGGYLVMKIASEGTSKSLQIYAKAGGVAEEAFRLIRTVISFGGESYMTEKYQKQLRSAEEVGIKMAIKQGLALGFVNGAYLLTYAPLYYFGAVLIRNDRISATENFPPIPISNLTCLPNFPAPSVCGDYVFEDNVDVCGCFACECGCFANGADDCFPPGDVLLVFISVLVGGFGIGQAFPSFQKLADARIAAREIYDIIDRIPEGNEGDDKANDLTVTDGKIEFKNICFSYPTRSKQQVLNNFSACIEPGKTVAFVGSSGSGKSTAFQLLLRNYEPSSGEILIDNTNISTCKTKSIRDYIGLVSQEPVLFATTILENIKYGREDASMEEVIVAAKQANAHNFIEDFPEGYETFCGEGGALLSGGQKQRIAIARAIIKNPKIIMLDEATSALDNESERIVQAALDNLISHQNCTMLVIAHRLTTIRNVDQIVVFDNGQVAEQGSHDELVEYDGIYNALLKTSETPKNEEDTVEKYDIDERNATSKGHSKNLSKASASLHKVYSDANAEVIVTKKSEHDVKVKTSRLMQYAKPELKLYPIGIISAGLNGAKEPIFSLIFSKLTIALYSVTIEELMDKAGFYSWMFVVIAIGGAIGIVGQHSIFGYCGTKMTTRIRAKLFYALMNKDVEFYDQTENSVGTLSTRLSTDAAHVKGGLGDTVGLLVQNLVALITGLGIAFFYGWELTLVLLVVLPFVALGASLEFIIVGQGSKADEEALGKAGQVLTESVLGMRTVKAFNLERRVEDLYNDYLISPQRKAMLHSLSAGLAYGFSQGSQFVIYCIAFRYGGVLVDEGKYTPEDLLIVIFAILLTALGLGQSTLAVPDIGKASGAIKRVFAVIDQPGKINSSDPSGIKLDKVTGSINLKAVDFSYPTRMDITVFKGLSLNINSGETVALVGQSGSGKSTITSLVERFYDPLSGSIKLDGTEISDLNVSWLRGQIGFVMQEPNLFAGSISENIAFGKYGDKMASHEEIVAAAKSANAHDFISEFPDGYDTMIASTSLSGGQKQRIAIARAIIRNPSILLLDEATSALDNESEKIVQQALDKLLSERKRTTIVVAHRLSTIRNANKIVVIEKGEVLEKGTHEELLKKNGVYAKLYEVKAQE